MKQVCDNGGNGAASAAAGVNQPVEADMAALDRRTVDLWSADSSVGVLHRFGVRTLAADTTAGTATMTMPLTGLTNPFTGLPTTSPLGVLVDAAAGIVNHFRRADDEWTVTSELAFEIMPDAIDAAHHSTEPIVATAEMIGRRGATSLSCCKLTHGSELVGLGTVRSFYIGAEAVRLIAAPDGLDRTPWTSYADVMAVEVQPSSTDKRVLVQHADSTLNNAIGIVNGGVAAAALELAASAAINSGRPAMRTASLKVNFARPFIAGGGARYEGRAVRVGNGSAIAEASAVNADNSVALSARLTAYR